MTLDSSISPEGISWSTGTAATGAGISFTGAGFSATGAGAGVGVGAGSAFGVFSLAGDFFVALAEGSFGAVALTERGFFGAAASPSGLAVFFVDEVAMPGEGGGFRFWRLSGPPGP